MHLVDWQAFLDQPEPPGTWPVLVQALWWDARGDWERAHTLAQEIGTPDGASVHAFLHRREGDLANAAYWYRRAGRPICGEALDTERFTLAQQLLASADIANRRLP